MQLAYSDSKYQQKLGDATTCVSERMSILTKTDENNITSTIQQSLTVVALESAAD